MALIHYPDMKYPKMLKIFQKFEVPKVEDVPGRVVEEIARINVKSRIKPGASIAVAAGSRGIRDIAKVVHATVSELKKMGAKPFIIPAMGSHGGATPEGQKEVLARYGITEETMGVPIRATMEVVQVSEMTELGPRIPVYMDKYAYEADHVVVINRIKPHTDFTGDLGSGLQKMMNIGLGKHVGALLYHKAFVSFGYANVIKKVAQKILETGKILFGVGIVENSYDETANIVAVLPENLVETELELERQASKYLAHLPFDVVDLLIVDEMGKDISGAGMDPNVHGRIMNLTEKPHEKPKIKRIFVRDLTEDTHGNATGIGFADFTTRRLINKIDPRATYINCITGIAPEVARFPMTFDTDREAIDVALNTIGLIEPENARVIWIKNTLVLGEVIVSEAYRKELETRSDLMLVKELGELAFDSEGNLIPGF
jgi:hypothetical protein